MDLNLVMRLIWQNQDFNSGSDKIFGIWRVNEEGKKLQTDGKEGVNM